jgi:hypothetical protein
MAERKNKPPEMREKTQNGELIIAKKSRPRGIGGAKRKYEVDEKFIATARKLSGRGLTHTQIHSFFCISHETWFSYLRENPELKAAVQAGRSKMISYVAGKLLQLCKKGNLKAIIFYLQNQAYFGMEKFDDDGNLKKPDAAAPTPLHQLTKGDPQEAARIYQIIMTGS